MPQVFVIGGPNGAGKTTLAETLLPDYLKVSEYVNADLIAGGLSAFNPGTVALEAGRLMLKRIHELAEKGVDFAYETTLASRSFSVFLEGLKERGYSVTLLYVWLRSPDLAVKRVRLRAEAGGHDVSREIVIRRYRRGLLNLRQSYLRLSDEWFLYDNSGARPILVAERLPGGQVTVHDQGSYTKITEA